MSDSSDDDDSLSMVSESFDPLRALYSPNIRLPYPSAPILDNISKYASLMRGPQEKKPKTKKKEAESRPSASGVPGRRFLPHQMPIQTKRPQRLNRDVLSRVEETTAGPLAVLRACMNRRLRVKVYTRNMNSVRGYCEAFVVAFDKHWNLAMEDVREVWCRKRRRKVPALDTIDRSHFIPSRLPPCKVPKVTIEPAGRGLERCERHVGQLFIRGEQVVLVSIADYKETTPKP